jgi:hypothetical protein
VDATVRTIAFVLCAALLLAVSPSPEGAPLPPDPDPVATTVDEQPVTASYFGPGLWGNRTACGQILTSDLTGVAHRSLPCGSLVTLRYGESTVVVPVVDRGPFNYTREFDLTYATKAALACRDLCALFWVR